MKYKQLTGAGLGLRRPLIDDLQQLAPGSIDFLELAPENWMAAGGWRAKALKFFAQNYPLVCHGLSLSLGGPKPLDEIFLKRVKQFLDQHDVALYSEHLSYCSDDGQLYDLLPIPFTEEAVHYVAKRIRRTQEIVERRIAIENVSYYATTEQHMSEVDFINAVLTEADCDLLLDVNNTYVNSINHGYDPKQFIEQLSANNIAYIHIAGHEKEQEDLLIDTHGEAIIDPVWDLLTFTYNMFGVLPTLLERDFNLPSLSELLKEIDVIKQSQVNAKQDRGHG